MKISFSQKGKPSKLSWLEFKKDVIYMSLNCEHLLGDGYGNKIDGLIDIIEPLGGSEEMIVINGHGENSSNPLIIKTCNFETEGNDVSFSDKSLDLLAKCIVVLAKFYFGNDLEIVNLETKFDVSWEGVLDEIESVLGYSIDIHSLT